MHPNTNFTPLSEINGQNCKSIEAPGECETCETTPSNPILTKDRIQRIEFVVLKRKKAMGDASVLCNILIHI